MTERKSIIKKAAILVAASLVYTILWFSGLEMVYAKVLTFFTNVIFGLLGGVTEILIESDNGAAHFRVITEVRGQRGSFTQVFGSLLIPAVMMFAWQTFTAFYLDKKSALKSTALNIGIFFAVQIIFLMILSRFYASTTARYIYELFLDSFYIFALAIIIIDNIRNPIFLKPLFAGKK